MKKRAKLSACSWLLALLLPACSTVEVQEPQNSVASLEPDESVTVLLSYHSKSYQEPQYSRNRTWNTTGDAHAAENSISNCVTKAVHQANPSVKVIPPDEFRHVAFPDLEFEEAPHSVESLTLLLNNPTFLNRIAPLKLRYLVIVGSTETEVASTWGSRIAAGIVWDKSSHLTGVILDIKEARALTAELATTASGKSWAAIALPVFVLGFPALSSSAACDSFGKVVAKAIVKGVDKP